MVDAYPVPQQLPVVYTTERDTQRLLGMPVTLDEMAAALQRLEFQVRKVDAVAADAPADATFALARWPGEPLLECIPPWYRLDIQYPADLTEEVARIIGYEHVGTSLLDDRTADAAPQSGAEDGGPHPRHFGGLRAARDNQPHADDAGGSRQVAAGAGRPISSWRTRPRPNCGRCGVRCWSARWRTWRAICATPTGWRPSRWAASICPKRAMACCRSRSAA